MPHESVLFEILPGEGGSLSLMTLNRPEALNALTHDMCRLIEAHLKEWQDDPSVKAIVVQGIGDKAFCAGGDIRQLYEDGRQGHYTAVMQFFRDEYRLNHQIATCTKPYIALMDGITMGGGAGLSVHGHLRIGTERLVMAMPETGIGFFPDIGATYFLPRCPDEMGTYLGLTGDRIDASDAKYLGLIDYFIPSHHLGDAVQMLIETPFESTDLAAVKNILSRFAVASEPSTLYSHRQSVAACFAHDNVENIILALKKCDTPWHDAILEKLRQKSPTSLKVTLAALRRGIAQDLAACLQMEIGLCEHFIRDTDLYEGIRALLIDRDKNPFWQPASLEEVSQERVDSYFQDCQ